VRAALNTLLESSSPSEGNRKDQGEEDFATGKDQPSPDPPVHGQEQLAMGHISEDSDLVLITDPVHRYVSPLSSC
jgi:hypothetical protein